MGKEARSQVARFPNQIVSISISGCVQRHLSATQLYVACEIRTALQRVYHLVRPSRFEPSS